MHRLHRLLIGCGLLLVAGAVSADRCATPNGVPVTDGLAGVQLTAAGPDGCTAPAVLIAESAICRSDVGDLLMVWDDGPRCLVPAELLAIARTGAAARVLGEMESALAARYPGAMLSLVMSVPSPTEGAACGRDWVLDLMAAHTAAADAVAAAADDAAMAAVSVAVPDYESHMAACLEGE